MIKGIASKYISKAFDRQLSDTITTFTAKRVSSDAVYDPDVDRMVFNSIKYQGRGVLSSYKNHEVDHSNILLNDTKMICLQNEVTDTPHVNDTVTADDETYRVINVEHDPAEVTWNIQLRGIDVK